MLLPFTSLFGDDSRHMAVIKTLTKSGSGLTRKEITEKTGLSSGGTITDILDELSQSGFITPWNSYELVTKESVYKLSDEYTYFYQKFIADNRLQGKGSWKRFSEGASWKSWSGIAFERICLKHIEQLNRALRVDGYNKVSAWRYRPVKGTGAQIDLVIDRKDFVINLCEMKFSEKTFVIDKAYTANLRNKLAAFKQHTATQKQLHLILVTSFGIAPNEYERELVEKTIQMDALFES